jgi:microsomal dipeptidase-like Zn-dependent dipeptidase
MTVPIIDLHCDLLYYLETNPKRTPYDLVARCAIPQLRQGQVKMQTLAIFTQTEPHSWEKGLHQARIYQELPARCPQDFVHASPHWTMQSPFIAILMAFENASGFCHEQEPLQVGFKRLENIIKTIAKPLYISLTWNTENRFGGGALTQVGLKEDGKCLLEELDQQRIAVDLSHASDALAYEIIDYIEGRCLNIPLMASHSNARVIALMPRNLPDEIAKEIFRRGGIIGLNLYRPFIGETEHQLIAHIAHWLELGGEHHVALGADFFYEADLPSTYRYGKEVFFKDYQDATCYGRLLSLLQKELKLKSPLLEKFAHQNAWDFMKKLGVHEECLLGVGPTGFNSFSKHT